MKKKYLFCFAFIYFCISVTFAQYNRKASTFEFNHGLGANILYFNAPVSDGQGIVPAVCWLPRFNFVRFSADATFSVKIPVVLFLVGSMNSETGGSGAFYMDAALAVDFNYGMMATKASTVKVGFYCGAGVGYSPLRYNYVDYYTNEIVTSDKTIGIYGNIGIKFPALIKMKGRNSLPNNVGFYTIVGFNNILIAGIRISKEFGYAGVKKKGW